MNPICDADFVNEFGERRREVQCGTLRVIEYVRDMEVGDWLVASNVSESQAQQAIEKYLKQYPPIGRTGYTFYIRYPDRVVTLYGY